MKTKFTVLLMALAVMVAVSSTWAVINHPGTYGTLQQAVNAATGGEGVVVTDGGTYSENIALTASAGSLKSVPAGAKIAGTVTVTGTGTVVIDGFTIDSFSTSAWRNGVVADGAGVDLTVKNCYFNRIGGFDEWGPVYNETGVAVKAVNSATVALENVEINMNNTDTGVLCGTGIYVGSGVNFTADRVKVYGRSGAVWESAETVPYRYKGALILDNNASADITNCLFRDGDSTTRLLGSANANFDFCTFWNSANSTTAMRLYNDAGQTMNVSLTNSIWGGGYWHGIMNVSAGTVNFAADYNLINITRTTNWYYGVSGGTHDLASNSAGYAGLVDAAGGDLRPAIGSPAIDSANPASAISIDIAGNTRPAYAGYDRGCYEYVYVPVVNSFQAIIDAASAGSTITLGQTDVYAGDLGVTVNKNLTIRSVPAGAAINDSISIASGCTVTLSGLVINPDRVGNGITLASNSTAAVSGCVVKNAKFGGIPTVSPFFNAGCGINVGANAQLTVLDSELSNNYYNGISSVGGAGISIQRTKFSGGVHGTDGLGGWSGDWIDGRQYSAYIAVENVNSLNVVNCLLTGPSQNAIRVAGSTAATIDHNTIDGSTSYGNGYGSGGVVINPTFATNITLTNNIIVKNAAFVRADVAGTGTITSNYNFCYNTCWVNYHQVTPGAKDTFGKDPMFAGSGNYHLLPSSMAALAGDPASVLAVDFEGKVRPMPAGTKNDAGCYEEQTSAGFNPLQALINATANGGTLTITDSGEYAGQMGLLIKKSIVIKSVPAGASIVDQITIDADSAYAPITVSIDGFNITGNGGLNTIDIVDASSVALSNCYVKSTSGLDYDGSANTGYAIVGRNGVTLTVSDCQIEIVGDGSSSGVEAMGGIFAGQGVNLVAHRDVIHGQDSFWGDSDNEANRYKGNIVLDSNASADIANCLLLDGDGSSVRINGSANAIIEHCTIRESLNSRVSAIRLFNTGSDTMKLVLRNNIISGGWWFGVRADGIGGKLNYTDDYNIFQQTRNQTWYYGNDALVGGANNQYSGYAEYPSFVRPGTPGQGARENVSANDYHLTALSPAINAGLITQISDPNSYGPFSDDLDGSLRPSPAGTDPDLGCYENQTNRISADMEYYFEDGSGTVAANTGLAGSAFNGTLTNMDNSDWVVGRDGSGAVDLDGINDYVSIPGSGVTTANITMSAWVKRNGSQIDWTGLIYDRADGPVGLHLWGSSHQLTYSWAGTDAWDWNSGLFLRDGVWTFVALSVEQDKGTLYMYVPGDNEIASAVWTQAHPQKTFNNVMDIGRDQYGGRNFKGQVDDVNIFNRSLNSAEIAALAGYVVPNGTTYTARYVANEDLVEGFPANWDMLKSDTVHQMMEGEAAANGKDRQHDIDFAWNEQFLFIRVAETVVDDDPNEGTVAQWEATPYQYDGVGLYNAYETQGFFIGASSDGQERVLARHGGLYAAQNTVVDGKRISVVATEWINIIPDPEHIAFGYRFVCNPLIVDSDAENWYSGVFVWDPWIVHQSFIGGGRHTVAPWDTTNIRLGLWGDINQDQSVDLLDVAVMALWWNQSDCFECGGADIAPDSVDGKVNVSDLVRLTSDWLK